MKNIVVIGANGQVGQAFSALLTDRAQPLSRNELDLSKPNSIAKTLAAYQPDIVINAAAYTAVDKAESEEELATTINGEAVDALARYCFEHHIPLVHFSTDYVFDGRGTAPWKEGEKPHPINAYGRSKLSGERAIEEAAKQFKRALPRWLVFRTSWVYDEGEKNFLHTMLKLAHQRSELAIVDDQIGAPTYAADIAAYTMLALDKAIKMPNFPSGIYHLCNQGHVSWCGFAKEIFKQAKSLGAPLAIQTVNGITSKEYPTPAARPKNSRLDMHKLHAVFSLTLPDWQNALSRCLKAKGEL